MTDTTLSAGATGVRASMDGDASARRLHIGIIAGLTALLVLAPYFVYPVFIMKVLCFALFALAFNLLLGYGGLFSFGHAAYFGTASYLCAYSLKHWGVTPEAAIILAVLFSAVLGAVFGAIAIRRQGIYFAMITLALAQMVFFFSLQFPGVTGGEDGIQSVPRGALFGVIDLSSDMTLYWVVLAIFLSGMLAAFRIVNSPFGEICRAIRDNEARMQSLGYNTNVYKLAVFVLSAALTGLAGSTKAVVFQLASLTDVHWSMSGEVILMTLIGGLGTLFGPVVGALAVVSMQNYLAPLGAWVAIIQGCVFAVCVLLFRDGIVGTLSKITGRPL